MQRPLKTQPLFRTRTHPPYSEPRTRYERPGARDKQDTDVEPQYLILFVDGTGQLKKTGVANTVIQRVRDCLPRVRQKANIQFEHHSGIGSNPPKAPVKRRIGLRSTFQRLDSLLQALTASDMVDQLFNLLQFIARKARSVQQKLKIVLVGFSRGAFLCRLIARYLKLYGVPSFDLNKDASLRDTVRAFLQSNGEENDASRSQRFHSEEDADIEVISVILLDCVRSIYGFPRMELRCDDSAYYLHIRSLDEDRTLFSSHPDEDEDEDEDDAQSQSQTKSESTHLHRRILASVKKIVKRDKKGKAPVEETSEADTSEADLDGNDDSKADDAGNRKIRTIHVAGCHSDVGGLPMNHPDMAQKSQLWRITLRLVVHELAARVPGLVFSDHELWAFQMSSLSVRKVPRLPPYVANLHDWTADQRSRYTGEWYRAKDHDLKQEQKADVTDSEGAVHSDLATYRLSQSPLEYRGHQRVLRPSTREKKILVHWTVMRRMLLEQPYEPFAIFSDVRVTWESQIPFAGRNVKELVVNFVAF